MVQSKKYFKDYHFKNHQKLRESVFHVLGHECIQCGEFDKRVLQFDRINGSHNSIIRKFSSNNIYARYGEILKHSDNYQILCVKCNWIKRYTHSEVVKK